MGDGWLGYVTDANLWIDLLHEEIESQVFRLPWEFIAPDVVLAEILLPYSWKLQGLGLIEMELTGEGMRKAEELVRKYPRPGRRDILSLALAMQERAMLLTGDEALRRAAIEEGIEVHGTLWLLDAMVKEGAISKEEGCRSLEKMLDARRRLPKKEVLARIAAWSEFVRHR